MKVSSLFLMLLLATSTSLAQVRVSRSWFHDLVRSPAPAGPIPTFVGGVEMFRSFGSLGNEQAWQFRLHAVAEIYRFTDSTDPVQWSTSVEFHHELTANPYSQISFNPRTARWEEQVLIHMATSTATFRAGWIHRCKHEIDNLEGANELAPDLSNRTQRTLIFTGPTIGAASAPFNIVGGSGVLAATTEWYAVAEDYRLPRTAQTALLYDQVGAVTLRGEWSLPLGKAAALRTSLWTSIPWFRARHNAPAQGLPYDARAELALSVLGPSARIDFVLATERQFDEVVLLTGQPTSLVQFGLRFAPR
jgi:hypothetical protein